MLNGSIVWIPVGDQVQPGSGAGAVVEKSSDEGKENQVWF